MTIRMRVFVASAAAAGALLLASCSPGDLIDNAIEKGVEKGLEAATGGEVNIDQDGGQFSFETEEGAVSLGVGVDLPADFPDEVPLVDGQVFTAMKVADGDADGFMVTILVDDTLSGSIGQAASLLEGAGFTQASSAAAAGMDHVVYEGTGEVTSVTLSGVEEPEDRAVLTYTVTTAVE